jgi:hypothetical protein
MAFQVGDKVVYLIMGLELSNILADALAASDAASLQASYPFQFPVVKVPVRTSTESAFAE